MKAPLRSFARILARTATVARCPLGWALLLLGAAPLILQAQTQIPAAINYQGRLSDALGTPLTNGYYVVDFKIWDDPTKSGDADYIWGRSFPIHVVEGGLFNVLLSDDGGLVGSPRTNDLRYAFSGPNRYLGLTVTSGPHGTIPSPAEISPRQQMASAPYAMQAQVANQVVPGAVGSVELKDGSVSTDKLPANAVTSDKIATGAVNTDALANGAVSSAKLGINGDVFLNGHALQIRAQSNGPDVADYLVWDPAYDGVSLYGWNGGNLGVTGGGAKPVLTWNAAGNVGIGVQNPTRGKLEISGFGSPVNLPQYGWLNGRDDTTGLYRNNTGSIAYSIYASDRIACVEFNAFSDARIKKVLGVSDGRQDLRRLLGIEITDYAMVDSMARGNQTYKKVIGQQVERVYPEAVSWTTEVVPDIYVRAEARDGWIRFATPPSPPLRLGDRVKLITDRASAVQEVVEVDSTGFRVREPVEGVVFVYGREVSDFRVVDYEAIAMLNVSATQELHRRWQATEAQVAALAQQNAALEARLAKLEGRKSEGLFAKLGRQLRTWWPARQQQVAWQ